MSLFSGIRRVWNEAKDDDIIIKEAAGRQSVFNTRCRFQDFGFYDINSIPFYLPTLRSALPSDFKVCQDCFKASVAPTALVGYFMREIKSSRDPEQYVECVLSDPTNEPAWKASLEQGREAPLVQQRKEVAGLAANLSKCPKEGNTTAPSLLTNRVGFRVLRSQSQQNRSFKICNYHFAAIIQGTWVEDEFVRLRDIPSGTLCDFGASEISGAIALVLAKRSFNFKIFEEWTAACRTLAHGKGIIHPGQKKYHLPAVKYTTASQFQVCEACYRLIFAPHTIVRPHFIEIPTIHNHSRGLCSINESSANGYIETLLKSTWKQDSRVFLDFARDQAEIPPCPGPSATAHMRIWYGSDDVPSFICCEFCTHKLILPSRLYNSFGYFPKSDSEGDHCCNMSVGEVRELFESACKSGGIIAFRTGFEKLVARAQNGSVAEQSSLDDYSIYPESDLSKVQGTPDDIRQIEALRDEIIQLREEAERKMARGVKECRNGLEKKGYGAGLSLISGTGDMTYRVFDGHGTWFDNSTMAEGSAMQIEGRMKMEEATKLWRMTAQKRTQLADMKARLTPAGL